MFFRKYLVFMVNIIAEWYRLKHIKVKLVQKLAEMF